MQSPASDGKASKIEIKRRQKIFSLPPPPPFSTLSSEALGFAVLPTHGTDTQGREAGVRIGEEEEADERGSGHRGARRALNPTDVTAERERERGCPSAIKGPHPPYFSAHPTRPSPLKLVSGKLWRE